MDYGNIGAHVLPPTSFLPHATYQRSPGSGIGRIDAITQSSTDGFKNHVDSPVVPVVQRSPLPRCPCPIFENEVENNQPHTCNGGGGNNMSELRTHMTRGARNRQPHLLFLELCKTCNHDFIDETIFKEKHGVNCHYPRPQRRGAAAVAYYEAFKQMVLAHHRGERAVSTGKHFSTPKGKAHVLQEQYLEVQDGFIGRERLSVPVHDRQSVRRQSRSPSEPHELATSKFLPDNISDAVLSPVENPSDLYSPENWIEVRCALPAIQVISD